MNHLSRSLLVGLLEQENHITGFYGGGFKPPTKGHFAVVKKSLEQFPDIDKFYIVVGSGIRDGVSQDESYSVWNIYKKYLGDKVEIVKADSSPLKYIKDYIKDNTDHKSFVFIGSRDGNDVDAQDFIKRKDFFENYGDHVEVKNIITKGGVSGTKAREAAQISKEQFRQFLPDVLTQEEIDTVYEYISTQIQELAIKNKTVEFAKSLKSKFKNILQGLKQEGKETREAFNLILKHARGEKILTPDEKKQIGEQLKDLLRLSGLAAVSILPGGTIAAILIKVLKKEKWITPSSFRKDKEEITEDKEPTEYTNTSPKHNYDKNLVNHLRETLLDEIKLNPDNAVEINGDTNNGIFKVEDVEYVYKINLLDPNPFEDEKKFYNIHFHPKDNTTDIPTGESTPQDYIKILSTLYKIILDFSTSESPDYIGISSIDSFKNYHGLYNDLTKQNPIPGYSRKISNLPFETTDGKSGKFVVLKKKEEINEGDKLGIDQYARELMKENDYDSFDYNKHIKDLTQFMLDQGLELNPLPSVKFINDDIENANNHLKGKTAYYDPNYKRIVLYTLNRHPKDVMRSFAHEMIHHMQNCEDRLGNIGTQDIDEDDHLRNIESEAYEKGNLAFRSYTGTLTEGLLVEGRYDRLSNQISSKIFNYWKKEYNPIYEDEQVIKYKFKVKEDNFDFDVKAELILDSGVDKFEILDYTGAGNKNGRDYIDVYFRTDIDGIPQDWELISMMLKDVIRHELEHLTHNEDGVSSIKIKHLPDDSLIRQAIKAKLLSQSRYYKLEKEIDAMLQGMYYRAKKERQPFSKILSDYLDSQEITPEEKQEILDLWSTRAKELNLPSVLQENEEILNPTIYVDMDGVIADFDERFRSLTGMEPRDFEDQYGKKKFWDFIDEENKVKFWVGIPVMPGAPELLSYVGRYPYEILTAPSVKKQSRLGKLLWIKNHASLFPSKPKVNFKPAKEKHLIKPNLTKNDILIDDRASTIDNWNAAGGTGIFYTSASQVINDLKQLGL